MSRNDDPMMVTVFEGLGDNEALFEDRNTLAVALRAIVAHLDLPDEEISTDAIWATAVDTLGIVFPDDPLGEQALYDCPAADGRNRLREELDAD